MILSRRDKPAHRITVQSRGNEIVVDRLGFVTITKGKYNHYTKVKLEALEQVFEEMK